MSVVSFGMSVSLDGFIADESGNLDWHDVGDQLHRHFNDLDREIGCHVYGRRLHESMRYWEPPVDEHELSDPGREYARIWQDIPKYVVSRTLSSVHDGYELLDGDLEDELESLKREHDGEISVGGATLAGSLMERGLVDELRRYVAPVVLGGGTPFFTAEGCRFECTLLEIEEFENGVVMERYAVGAPDRPVDSSP